MRSICLFFFLSVFILNSTQAQLGIRIGGNIPSIDSKGTNFIIRVREPGYHFGIMYEFSLNENYSIESGALFMLKSIPVRDDVFVFYGNFAMLEIPILLKRFVNFGEIPMDFTAGPTISYIDEFTGFYAGLQLGSGMEFNDFHVSVFYQINLSPLKVIAIDGSKQTLYGSNYGISVKYNVFMKRKTKPKNEN